MMGEYYNYSNQPVSRYIIIYFCIISLSFLAETAIASQESSDNQVPESVERIVKIDKELVPWKASYSFAESPRVLVELKFIKYKNIQWKLKNLRIKEMYDENLEIQDGSFGLAIGNISDINKYRTEQEGLSQYDLYSIKNINNSEFEIIIEKEFDSSKRVYYWYNVNIKRPGIFSTETVVISNPEIGIFSDIDQSLRLQIENFNLFASYWNALKELISVLSLIIGMFAILKLNEIKGMFIDLIQATPRYVIILFSLVILYIYSYMYFRSFYPKIYPAIDFLAANWEFYRGIMPMIILLLFTLILLYVNHLEKVSETSVHEWVRKIIKSIFIDMPPVIAFTFFMLLYALPLLLVILNL